MKKLLVYGLCAIFAAAAAPALGEEVDKTVDAAATGHVVVANTAGSIMIRGWSRDQVEVKGSLEERVEEVIVERDGNTVTIQVKVPKRGGRDIDADLRIQVPKGSSIDVTTVSSDIEVTDVQGEQTLESVSGDIDTVAFAADVTGRVVSGDIEIRGMGKDIKTDAGSVSGDVSLFRLAGIAEGNTVTGDVLVDDGSFDRATLSSVNGEVIFRSELRPGGKLETEAVNGTIDLEFKGGVSGRFEFDTLNGDIKNCFGPEPQRTSKYTPGWNLHFQEGDGDARVKGSTVNGDISICR
jgi:DUF4097 and DUF4098 domain-containing protein YvlB